MALRFRKSSQGMDLESQETQELLEMQQKNSELETKLLNISQLLEISKSKERKLAHALDQLGGVSMDIMDKVDSGLFFDNTPFIRNLVDRSLWLIGLLVFQSFSSFILSSNEALLHAHPNIIYFLTMLVGAGGNAGNQAAVRVIREIAVGTLNNTTTRTFIIREILMACALSFIVGTFGFVRVTVLSGVPITESVAISVSLMAIVLISVVCGALLPLLFQLIHFDPANSSTSIQVVMDISGVLITCFTSRLLLDTNFGGSLLRMVGF